MSNATDFGINTSFTVGTLRERSIGVHPKRTQHALSCSQPIIEPIEGDFFIRNGLLAMIAEKSE
ncbi:hypothetical protein AD932_00015, partial [Gluconobacter oxydans]